MDTTYRFRGRVLRHDDVEFIRALIGRHPAASRRALSELLCDAWSWTQPNGQRCDMLARSLMLDLERKGAIELPPRRRTPVNPLVHRRAPEPVTVDTTPLRCRLADLRPLEFQRVRRTPDEPLFNGLLAQYHYLAYTQPVGAHLKYLVRAHGRPIACFAFSSAPRHLGPRDRFIGWSPEARRANLHFVAYNPRYLILPWVEVEHLASHLLGRMVRILQRDWKEVYGHPLYFLETFIDPPRFKGTCYRAANWIPMGLTTGRGKQCNSKRPNRSLKEVLGYPLVPDFKQRLAALP